VPVDTEVGDVTPDAASIPDADGDTLSDADEGALEARDSDNDGHPDFEDDDSDSDGVSDSVEAGDSDLATPPLDSDTDGDPDYLDTDSDDNGIFDGIEGTGDSNNNGVPDSRDFDNDGDQIHGRGPSRCCLCM